MVSLRRMALYDQAFGLTMLRLWVVGAAVWRGLVLVARHNIDRARHGAELDIEYLAGLSDDATPTIAGAIDVAGEPGGHHQLVDALRCAHRAQGVAALNLAAARSADAPRDLCPT